MATPVPVVSIMYFFVFSPPKTTGVVRPAFCATSVKCTIGLAFAFSDFPVRTLGVLVERCADVNMLVFLRTLYRYLSNGIDSRSSADAYPSTACCGAVSLVRRCDDARCAIGFCENGCTFAGERHLPARYVGATEGRSGFCPRGFRKSRAACAEESRGAQLSRMG